MDLADRTYPADADSIPRVRDQVEAACAEAGLVGAPLESLLIAVSEAATNAVRHSGVDEFRVVVSHTDGVVEVVVRDHGSGLGDVDHDMPAPTAPGGRGLPLMEALVDECSIRGTGSGTEIRLRQPVASSPIA